MIQSVVGSGKIHAGDTLMAFTSTIAQTGAAALTVSEGSFTSTNGDTYPLAETALSLADGTWRLELGLQDGGLLLRNVAANALAAPDGWVTLQILAGFGSGIEVKDGTIVGDVYVLTVLPGFPDA